MNIATVHVYKATILVYMATIYKHKATILLYTTEQYHRREAARFTETNDGLDGAYSFATSLSPSLPEIGRPRSVVAVML